MSTIPVFVSLGGRQSVGLLIERGAYVFQLIDAAKLKMDDVTADMVTLRFAPSGAGEPLNPRNSLSEAGERSDLIVEVIHASPVGACIKGEITVDI